MNKTERLILNCLTWGTIAALCGVVAYHANVSFWLVFSIFCLAKILVWYGKD